MTPRAPEALYAEKVTASMPAGFHRSDKISRDVNCAMLRPSESQGGPRILGCRRVEPLDHLFGSSFSATS